MGHTHGTKQPGSLHETEDSGLRWSMDGRSETHREPGEGQTLVLGTNMERPSCTLLHEQGCRWTCWKEVEVFPCFQWPEFSDRNS